MDKDDKSEVKSKKPSKKVIYFLIILCIILAEGFILCYDYYSNEDSVLSDLTNQFPILGDGFEVISSNLNNVLSMVGLDFNGQRTSKLLGENRLGSVSVEGPYGNSKSPVKIAYILGQHPRESNAHNAIYNEIVNSSDNLNYSYYIYKINVSSKDNNFEKSRIAGQLLAEEFVVDDIINNGYKLAIDIHASNGGYVQDPYIFAPVSNDTVANASANNLSKILTYLIYYEPASYSSPQYSTIPIDEGGVPALVFEMRGNPDISLSKEANQFVHEVDKLRLK